MRRHKFGIFCVVTGLSGICAGDLTTFQKLSNLFVPNGAKESEQYIFGFYMVLGRLYPPVYLFATQPTVSPCTIMENSTIE